MRAYLVVIGLSLQACAQLPDSGSTSGTKTAFSRTQTSLIDSNKALEDGSRITSLHKQTQAPRSIERELFAVDSFPTEARLSEFDLELIAEDAVNKILPGSEFEIKHMRKGLAFNYVTLAQTHFGRRIVGAELTLRITSSGDWVSILSSFHPAQDLPSFQTDQDVTLPSFLDSSVEIISSEKVIYPRLESDSFHYYFAREVSVSDPVRRTGFMVWIDESTNEVVGEFNPEHSASVKQMYGSILPNSAGDDELWVPFPGAEIKSKLGKMFFNSLGEFDFAQLGGEAVRVGLRNRYLEVVNNDGPDNEGFIQVDQDFLNASPSLDFNSFSSLEERNIYYWVMKAREYLEQNLDFHEMDYTIVAMARDGVKLDNAYFNPLFKLVGRPVLGFGTGDTFFKNTALSRDIILHEYGHAVTSEIYGIKQSFEFSAMNEAFSDYFAATITEDPVIAEDMFIDPKRKYLRRLDNSMKFPQDFGGKYFHADGQMFSGALWQMRQKLGAELADLMIHEARLSQASSIVEFYTALLKIDEALDDQNEWTPSPNKKIIRDAFRHHGLNTRVQFVAKEQEDLTSMTTKCWSN